MSWLLYGIIAEDAPIVLEPELRLIKAEGLAAIVKACETEVSREPAIVLAFGQQVMHIHQQTTLIPMRYGSILIDEDTVMAHLLDHQASYKSRLAELYDCEEIGIRITLDSTIEEPVNQSQHTSGQNYLIARKRAYAIPEQAEQQVTILNSSLAGLYRQHCAAISLFNGQRTYLLSYLVSRQNLPAFIDCFNNLAVSIKGLGSISGPWPPYNFASSLVLNE